MICSCLFTALLSKSALKGGLKVLERNALAHNVGIIELALLAVAIQKHVFDR
jgi:hypothetical protein